MAFHRVVKIFSCEEGLEGTEKRTKIHVSPSPRKPLFDERCEFHKNGGVFVQDISDRLFLLNVPPKEVEHQKNPRPVFGGDGCPKIRAHPLRRHSSKAGLSSVTRDTGVGFGEATCLGSGVYVTEHT